MKVRFGYVANALNIKECSPSRAVTATNLEKIEDPEARIIKLRKISEENLLNTLRILRYNAAHDIMLYRLTSKLVPLATHTIVEGWDYVSDLRDNFREVGTFAKDHSLRLSAHPDHFTLINSPREEVLEASLRDLEYHEKVLDAMELGFDAKLVIHVGGLYKEKEASIKRFIDNYRKLSESLKRRIILENDDKVYTAREVLDICTVLDMPMVLDIHHHKCNPGGEDIGELIQSIFKTWHKEEVPPKIHLSSPRSEKDIRSHADYVEKSDFLPFLYKAKEVGMDFDVMIEAKQKDLALHKLMKDLKGEAGIEIINGAEILI